MHKRNLLTTLVIFATTNICTAQQKPLLSAKCYSILVTAIEKQNDQTITDYMDKYQFSDVALAGLMTNAIRQDYVDGVKTLVKHGASINDEDIRLDGAGWERTPLGIATLSHAPNSKKYLEDKQALSRATHEHLLAEQEPNS